MHDPKGEHIESVDTLKFFNNRANVSAFFEYLSNTLGTYADQRTIDRNGEARSGI